MSFNSLNYLEEVDIKLSTAVDIVAYHTRVQCGCNALFISHQH